MAPERCIRRLAFFLTLVSGCLGLSPLSIVLYSTTTSSGRISPDANSGSSSQAGRFTWFDRVHQLIEYRNQHGDTLVPKRYAEKPALGNWVNKQRQQYRKYVANQKPCSLTEEKIRVLNDVGFCWNGTAKISPNRRGDTWWKRLEELRAHFSLEEGLPTSLNNWMHQQRKEYQSHLCGEPCKLDEKKIKALNEIDPEWWKQFRQRQWEARCRELIEYREQHGDCCVPISYENRKLANWVSNLRKSYNLKTAGRISKLTHEQIQQLNEFGFVWNHWDYEYQKNQKKFEDAL